MTTFILTWGATDDAYDPDQYAEDITVTAAGQSVETGWSFGTRRQGVQAGDRVFLLRQRQDRGIIARGHVFDGVIRTGTHWGNSRKGAGYADVVWERVLPVEDRIPLELLLTEVKGKHWNNIYSSGQKLDPEPAAALEQLWDNHVAAKDPVPQEEQTDVELVGQGLLPSAQLRKALEDHAQTLVTRRLEKQDYTVTDTRVGNPYDCVATRGERKIYVEVKGTQSSQPTVLVTAGEVNHARAHRGQCALGIVTGIDVTDGEARGGSIELIEDWNPDAGSLTPTVFRHTPQGLQ